MGVFARRDMRYRYGMDGVGSEKAKYNANF